MTAIECPDCPAVVNTAAELLEHKAIYHSNFGGGIEASPRSEAQTAPGSKAEMRTCFKCKREKPISEFYPHRARGGFQSYCKTCSRAFARTQGERKARKAAEKERLADPTPAKTAEAPEGSGSIYCPRCGSVWLCDYAKLLRCPGCNGEAVPVVVRRLKVEVVR